MSRVIADGIGRRITDAPLANRFRVVFIGYSTLVVLLLGLMSIWANEQLERTVHEGIVANEIKYYSALFANPAISEAKNSNATAWLRRAGESDAEIPAPLAILGLGMHEDFSAMGSPDDVFVVDTELGRMYIVLDGKLIEQRETEFVYMLIGSSVFLMLMSIVIAKFASLWLTRPIQQLSAELSTFEPGSTAQRLRGEYNGPEVELLTSVINNYQSRVEKFIEREQALTSLISHELRNPLAIISGSADVLQLRHAENSTDRPPIDRIKNSARTMSADIDALLMLARETARPDGSELCNIAATSQQVVASFKDKLEARKITLTQRINSTVKLPVTSAMFAMLLSNLLDNAIRHSHTNTIELEVNNLGVVVVDSGCGIPRKALLSITQASTQAANNGGGFGLGLYIVEQICDRLDWKLTIISEEGIGTEFNVMFLPPA